MKEFFQGFAAFLVFLVCFFIVLVNPSDEYKQKKAKEELVLYQTWCKIHPSVDISKEEFESLKESNLLPQ